MNSFRVRAFIRPRFGVLVGKMAARSSSSILFGICSLHESPRNRLKGFQRRLTTNGNWLPEAEWNSISNAIVLQPGCGLKAREELSLRQKSKLAGTQCGVSGQFAYSARPSL